LRHARRRLLISLRPEYAEEIYAGRKHYEFRRVRMRVEPGEVVVIYETLPVGAVTGEFTIAKVVFGGTELAGLERSKRRAEAAAEYLAGARAATALKVSSPRRYRRKRRLADVGLSRAPQSYCWLDR